MMVSEVNAAEAAPEEHLTDSVYHYDADEHIFELGESFEQRMEERASEKAECSSVLKDLQSKVQDMDLRPKSAAHPSKTKPTLWWKE